MWTEAFLEYLTLERNYSLRTVEEYRDDLNAFESYYKKVDSTLSWETIDGDVVRDWMVSMMEAGRTATTVNRRLSALRTFYRYLLKRDWIKADPVRNIQGPKKKKPLPVFLKESEMDRLLDGEFFGSDFLGKRDKLIVNTFYVTGVRLSELTGLNNQDVDLWGGVIKVTGKRNKQRIVPFGRELEALLRTYLDEKSSLGMEDGGAMFVDEKGERIYQITNIYEEKAEELLIVELYTGIHLENGVPCGHFTLYLCGEPDGWKLSETRMMEYLQNL